MADFIGDANRLDAVPVRRADAVVVGAGFTGLSDGLFALIERLGIACAPRRNGWIEAAHTARVLAQTLRLMDARDARRDNHG